MRKRGSTPLYDNLTKEFSTRNKAFTPVASMVIFTPLLLATLFQEPHNVSANGQHVTALGGMSHIMPADEQHRTTASHSTSISALLYRSHRLFLYLWDAHQHSRLLDAHSPFPFAHQDSSSRPTRLLYYEHFLLSGLYFT